MDEEILDRLVSSFMALDMPQHSFGWQGGEPTLLGLYFFKKATDLQQKHGKAGQHVSNGLQTNGILLDDVWCQHLAKYKFLVGISLDGPAVIHDRHRVTVKGEPSHGLVIKGLEALRRNNVEFNVLTLVSDSNATSPLIVYNYLKELGVNYHQYIECVEFDDKGELMPYAVSPGQWGEFLCTIFDEWFEKDTRKVSVRLFDSVLSMLVDNLANVCSMDTDCRNYFVVEHNGDIYPCDFFVLPELKLGNIMHNNWAECLESPIYKKFGEKKRKWNDKCGGCPFLRLCAGCCPKNRPMGESEMHPVSALCEGWKIFYRHTLPRFKILADQIRSERITQMQLRYKEQMRISQERNLSQRKSGRNEPCPCGSGKKYKRCCG